MDGHVSRPSLSTIKAHGSNGRNIVGQQHATLHVGPINMLRPFAWNHNNVGTCSLLLRIV